MPILQSALADLIRSAAQERGETLSQAVRHHLLTAIIARVAVAPAGDGFVLRGGMLTREWVRPLPRPTTDLDYVGHFSFDQDETVRRFAPALTESLDDGVCINVASLSANGIWLDSGFPGVRLTLRLGLGSADQTVSIDIGFNDPLVPAPMLLEISGTNVRCVRPETQVAWKLHALAEMGGSFRPKDLADLWRISARLELDTLDLSSAINAAFMSRGFKLAEATELLSRPYWSTKTARVRWAPNRTGVGLPDLPRVLADVRGRLEPALAALR